MATQMPLSEFDRSQGVKSSRSGPNGACFYALRLRNGDVATWNSRAGDDEVAHIHTAKEWIALVAGVKAGELDLDKLPVAS